MKLKQGDYVLATKWRDGDPLDHWYVGFFQGKTWHGRYDIVDGEGDLVRGNSFRKAQRITDEIGEFLLRNVSKIQASDKSLWWWKTQAKKEIG